MTIYHKHHIIPRHMGGTDDPENLVSVTIEQHAELHRQLWEELGYKEDYIAWQALSGLLTMSEIKKLALQLGPKLSGEKCKKEKIGYMGLTKEQNVLFGKMTVSMQKGIHDPDWDKAIGGRKGGQKCKEEGIGFLAPGFDLGKSSRGKIHISFGDKEKKIFPDELEEYIKKGWKKGRTEKRRKESVKFGLKCKEEGIGFLAPGFDIGKGVRGKKRINKNGVTKLVYPADLDKYIEDGWVLGRAKKKKDNI